jgi:NADH:ubiquinone oxidoreductase subunit 2 (subunit N)
VIERGGGWYITLAIIGVLNSAVSLYYYARIVKAMFLDRPRVMDRIPMPRSYSVMLGVFMAAVVVFGIYFEGLRKLAESSLRMFGHV